MFTFRKRVSRFENHVDDAMDKFIFHHKFLGLLMIFIGMPLAILTAVCVCSTMITLLITFLFG